MQTAADRDFTYGLRLLLAARRIETCEDDYAWQRLQALAESYRMRAHELMAGVGAPADQV